MTPAPDLFRPLSGSILTERGRREIHRGDRLPADLLPGERERLIEADAIGVPPGYEIAPDATISLDVLVSQRHYFDHVAPVAEAIRAPVQMSPGLERALSAEAAGDVAVRSFMPGDGPVVRFESCLVCGPRDIRTAIGAGWSRIAYLCHGFGQDYLTRPDGPTPGGGIPWDRVELLLLPSEYAGRRFDRLCPDAERVVIGTPKMDALRAIPRPEGRTAAISFRWRHNRVPESSGAYEHYRPSLGVTRSTLAGDGITLLGHSHPKIFPEIRTDYAYCGIEPVRDFLDVIRRAGVYVVDNSSTLFEFAALDRPVVVLNQPAYRRDVEHGGRFWEWADIGEQVDNPADLPAAVRRAFDLDPHRERRRQIIAHVAPDLGGESAAVCAANALWGHFPPPEPATAQGAAPAP